MNWCSKLCSSHTLRRMQTDAYYEHNITWGMGIELRFQLI